MMEWLRARLADDWRKLLSFASVKLHLVAMFVGLVYALMPELDPAIAGILPAPLQAKAIGLYAVIGFIVRVIKFKSSAAR